jgi:hypothetical protein
LSEEEALKRYLAYNPYDEDHDRTVAYLRNERLAREAAKQKAPPAAEPQQETPQQPQWTAEQLARWTPEQLEKGARFRRMLVQARDAYLEKTRISPRPATPGTSTPDTKSAS